MNNFKYIFTSANWLGIAQDTAPDFEGGLHTTKCLMYDTSSNSIVAEECIGGKGICKSNLG